MRIYEILYHLIYYITIAIFTHIRDKIFLVIYLKKELKQHLISGAGGIAVGIVNGMFGAGGGMLAVPILKKRGLSQKEAHANAIAVILPITVITAILYLVKGYVSLKSSLVYMPTGLLGAYLATLIMQKISPVWLKRIFGIFMIYAGIRLLMK